MSEQTAKSPAFETTANASKAKLVAIAYATATLSGLGLVGGLVGCGGGSPAVNAPIEDNDTEVRYQRREPATIPAAAVGQTFRYMESSCTEGRLDLSSNGYRSLLRIERVDARNAAAGVLLIKDETTTSPACARTVITKVTPPEGNGDLRIEELHRSYLPVSAECEGVLDPTRPGEITLEGNELSVRVQRSALCGGFESRFVYAQIDPVDLTDEEIARRYVSFFSLGDATRLGALFADTGSLLESFELTVTGDATRHDGRSAAAAWFASAIGETPWRALRATSVSRDEASRALIMQYEYIDPRVSEPFVVQSRMLTAAGEIFELQLEAPAAPQPAGAVAAPGSDGAAAPATPAEPASPRRRRARPGR